MSGAAYLYDGHGKPLTADAPPFDGPGGIVSLPACSLTYDPCRVGSTDTVDLVLALPKGASSLPLPWTVLVEASATFDRGQVIAIHASDDETAEIASAAIVDMTASYGDPGSYHA